MSRRSEDRLSPKIESAGEVTGKYYGMCSDVLRAPCCCLGRLNIVSASERGRTHTSCCSANIHLSAESVAAKCHVFFSFLFFSFLSFFVKKYIYKKQLSFSLMKLHFWHYPKDIALSMKGDDEPKGSKILTRRHILQLAWKPESWRWRSNGVKRKKKFKSNTSPGLLDRCRMKFFMFLKNIKIM